MNIFKHDNSSDRPLFTNNANSPNKPIKSSLTQNPLLNRLKPIKSPSRVAAFFKRTWAHVTKYFGVKHPSPIQENLKNLVRPEESHKTELTIGNLWHHYEQFLKEDRDCPPGLKTAFNKMEQDEKEILKFSRLSDKISRDEDKSKRSIAQDKFIKKTKRSIERMPVGTTRLLLLQRAKAGDHSLSGDLFCLISHTKDGFVLNFMGSGDQMDALQNGLTLAGKNKSVRNYTFDPIDKETFIADGFVSNLLLNWVQPEGVSPDTIQDITKNFTHKIPSTLEEYATKSNRPDKLFWNIVLSIPQENTKDTLQPGSLTTTQSIRLRTELLTLYEAFDEARIDLDPSSRRFKDLHKLLKNVSLKVLIDYEKNRLSDEDFRSITKRLKIIDDTLQKANSASTKTIPSHVSLAKPAFPNVSLKKAIIEEPKIVTIPVDVNDKAPSITEEEMPILSMEELLSLQKYDKINTKEEFLKQLTHIHALSQSLEDGSLDEQKRTMNEIFRFFHEVPVSSKDLVKNGVHNPDAFLWQFSKDEALNTIKTIGNTLENITKVKTSSEITQYDFEALAKIHNASRTLNAHQTGFWLDWHVHWHPRSYSRLVKNSSDARVISRDLLNSFQHISEYELGKDPTISKEDFDLILNQKNTLKNLNSYKYKPKHWLRPIHNSRSRWEQLREFHNLKISVQKVAT